MRIGFLVWNKFQVGHSVEIAKYFDEPDFIFIDRKPTALNGFDPAWLVPYGAYSRFISELDLHSLDGQYDAIVTQFRPPLKRPWQKSKLVMHQYSLAKPKTAYNARWFAADRGLVYGAYSESIIGLMCPVSQIGNPRFDPYFEGRLNPDSIQAVRGRLDPRKKTIVYLPTWGDLGTSQAFAGALEELGSEFNIIVRPHHLTSLVKRQDETVVSRLIHADSFPAMLDLGLYLQDVADLVISDMSGAIFDALYCRKPVILVGEERISFAGHKKADDSAIEVSQRERIGPYVTNAEDLKRAVFELTEHRHYQVQNKGLVDECFTQRGGCASLAATAIREAVEATSRHPVLQVYAAPDFSENLLSRAFAAAKKRRKKIKPVIVYPATLVKIKQLSGKTRLTAGIASLVARPARQVFSRTGNRVNAGKRGSQPASMKTLLKRGQFFAAGYMLERWNKLPQRSRAKALYQAQSTATSVRFSRRAWKSNLARLFQGIYAPSTTAGRQLLQKFGMLKSAESWYLKMGTEVPQELFTRLQILGPVAGVLDVAARNEVANADAQMCITPRGATVPLRSIADDRAVELYLLSSLSRDLKDENQRPYRSSQLQFSQNLIGQLLASGFDVYPRLQVGVDGATAVSLSRPAFTWHTLTTGRKGQFHLKIGTLFGHFIVDSKGYSGWSSIANKGLRELTMGVDQAVADAHWRTLHDELVGGMKSKYSQTDESLPKEWGSYIFLPMQVVDDTVARLSDIDALSLLDAMVNWAKSGGSTVVVKRHPMCKSADVAATIEEAERAGYIRVSNANIHQLIAGARCIVTVNSGVGAEALLQLKPVITTGRSDYAAATTRARTVQELYSLLDAGVGLPDTADEIRKFLWVYTKKYMVHVDDTAALRARLCDLLAEVGCVADDVGSPRVEIAAMDAPSGVTSIPFVTTRDTVTGGAEGTEDIVLGEQCDELLRALSADGIRCWLDSGSLLGLVRSGRLNDWEKDIDLGIWIDDFEKARKVCRDIAQRYSLWYREKSLKGLPYALLLSSHPGQKRSTLPISIHMFFRIADSAWSPQPFSLVSSRSKYPRFVYRETNGESKASIGQKLAFVVRHPVYSLCIVAEKLNATNRIGRSLRKIEQATSLKEKLLARLFIQVFQWKIPARYFNNLQPISEKYPHVFAPADVDDYLAVRYGDWRVPVEGWFYLVDDGCITTIPGDELNDRLVEAGRQTSGLVRPERVAVAG